MTEAQQRFLKEIADRMNGGRVAEVRLYPTLRVGPIESGVAIVATEERTPPADSVAETVPSDVSVEVSASAEEGVASQDVIAADGNAIVDEHAIIEESVTVADRSVTSRNERLSILTAHFRHTIKGPDRGKWEFTMVHDADAPIETVESVVRGVARRAGEDGEPELLSGDDFQRALVEPWWTATA